MRVFICFMMLWLLSGNLLLQAQTKKKYDFLAVKDFFKLPEGWVFGEASAVEINSKGHIFLFNRGDHKLLEFDPEGNFIREIGAGRETFANPHGLKIDAEDNLWTTDVDNHIVLKISPEGKILMVLGRKGIAGEFIGKWDYAVFNKPTDVIVASTGDIFVSDGYGNNRVVKFNKNGEFIKSWGEKGTGPGQFNLPHTIAVDKNDRIYVGDRENKRIQIFDTDGNFIEAWTDTGYPYCIQIIDDHLYTIDGVDCKWYKYDLKGNKLAEFGTRGFAPGEMSLPHWMDLNDENDIFVAEVLSWRFQKFQEKH